jgi:hypothetical protein
MILLAVGLTCVTCKAQWATNDFVVNTFDAAAEASTWTGAWGGATGGVAFDGSQDAQNPSTSGSLMLTAHFDADLLEGDNQFAFSDTLPLDPGLVLDASIYTNLEFDLLWDTTNSPSSGGTNFGPLAVFLNSNFASKPSLVGTYPVPTNAGWHHIVMPIDPTLPKIALVNGLVFQMWAPAFTGTTTFWLDNIKLRSPTNTQPRAHPTLSLKPATPGLQLVSTTFDGPGSRNNFFTATPGYSWIDAPTSTTYSVTIKNYPPFATHPYYQTHILLIPQGSLGPPANDGPDWNATNLIFLSIQSLTNGSGVALFMFKTNALGGGWQNQIWGRNVLAGLWSSNLLGTWSLSFNNNTNVTLTGPGHAATNFALPARAVSWFRDTNGLYVFFGTQPNRDFNSGQSSILSEVKITGGVDGFTSPSPDIDEAFMSNYLDPSIWGVTGYRNLPVATADTPYWLQWTLPDDGAQLMASQDLTPGDWYGAPYSPVQPGPIIQTLIPNSVFGTDSSFFMLSH